MTIDRTAVITGLRDIADFLDTNPDIPTPSTSVIVYYFADGASDHDARAKVDQIAAYLGATIDPEPLRHGHYQTHITFGPVTYRTVAISSEARARYRAFDTYAGCVDPDPIPDTAVAT
jgi:hypothetical protein